MRLRIACTSIKADENIERFVNRNRLVGVFAAGANVFAAGADEDDAAGADVFAAGSDSTGNQLYRQRCVAECCGIPLRLLCHICATATGSQPCNPVLVVEQSSLRELIDVREKEYTVYD